MRKQRSINFTVPVVNRSHSTISQRKQASSGLIQGFSKGLRQTAICGGLLTLLLCGRGRGEAVARQGCFFLFLQVAQLTQSYFVTYSLVINRLTLLGSRNGF